MQASGIPAHQGTICSCCNRPGAMAGAQRGATTVEVYGFVGWIASFAAAGEPGSVKNKAQHACGIAVLSTSQGSRSSALLPAAAGLDCAAEGSKHQGPILHLL
jgi:hypothetical protein